jgi:hypothetical protein
MLWTKLVVLVLLVTLIGSTILDLVFQFGTAIRKLYRKPNPARFWNAMTPVQRQQMLQENRKSDDYISRVSPLRWWDLPLGDRALLRDGLFLREHTNQAEAWNRLKAGILSAAQEKSIDQAISKLVAVAWLSLLLLAFYNAWVTLFCAVGLLILLKLRKKHLAARKNQAATQQHPKPTQPEITDEDIPF